MPNKELRFLIADGQHFYRLKIERALNQLGYYRVAPMQHLSEVISVVDACCEPIDLLVINASIAKSENFDLLSLLTNKPQVRYALIYGGEHASAKKVSHSTLKTVQVISTSLPDMSTLSQLMAVVDPQDDLLHDNIEAEIDRAEPISRKKEVRFRIH
ncbi:response regulator [Pseudomonas sp. NPDC087612]|uniref:response regulator n=1 Tax=Pseudomonas sp. NPDC087612 TaxID=3364441 RepID=UPI0037F3463B